MKLKERVFVELSIKKAQLQGVKTNIEYFSKEGRHSDCIETWQELQRHYEMTIKLLEDLLKYED